jgi:hypothetical protein
MRNEAASTENSSPAVQIVIITFDLLSEHGEVGFCDAGLCVLAFDVFGV